VDADAGVTNRGVTWTSGNTAVATVGTDGTVTAVGAGTTTVTATSQADQSVKGAASVTVLPAGGGSGGSPIVSIASTNTTVCDAFGGCNSVPANLQNFGTAALVGATGILDVVANVDANGGTLQKVTGQLTCGGKSITAQGGLGTANTAPTAAEAASVPISLQFNTVALDSTGKPLLFNTSPFNAANPSVAACVLTITASNGGTSTATATNLNVVLDNADIATVTLARSGSTASDAAGFPWVSGDVTVTVQPVLYTQRTAANIQVTLPNLPVANGPTEFKPADASGTTTFKWTNDATAANNVAQVTLTGGNDINGNPVGITPIVSVIDATGNDIPNIGIRVPPTQQQFRLDNQSPLPPRTFQIPLGQGQWVNASYTFFSSSSTAPAATSEKYMACGDAVGTVAQFNSNPAVCPANGGVSRSTTNSPIANGGQNPNSTLKIFAFDTQAPGVTVPGALTNGTSTSTTTCTAATDPTKGWIDVTTNAGPLTEGPTNSRYIIRAVETDKLGNIRCTDLSTTNNAINNTANAFARASIGSDKTAPTVPNNRLANSSEIPGSADDLQAVGIGAPIPNFNFNAVDNLSGLGFSPILTKVQRQDATNATLPGKCVIGSGSSCNQTPEIAVFGGIPADVKNDFSPGNPTAAPPVAPTPPTSSGIDGYYTYTASVVDLAGNRTDLPPRTVLVDRQAPVMGGIQVPATLTGGVQAQFQTQATDNLDLVSSDFTLTYNISPANGGAPLAIRNPGSTLGAAFDGTLTTLSNFAFTIPAFVRTIASTTFPGGAPQNNAALPTGITGRAYDAASNQSTPVTVGIQAANVPLTGPGVTALTNYAALQANGATSAPSRCRTLRRTSPTAPRQSARRQPTRPPSF
jgi:hypothetical protein